MATLSKRKGKNGHSWLIQFFDADGKRRTIALANAAESTAEEATLHVGCLANAKRNGLPIDAKTNRWLAGLRGPLRQKLVELGLTDEPIAATVGGFTRAYIDSRKDVKPMTKANLDQARKYLVMHFGEETPLAAVSAGRADQYRRWLRELLGENTTRRHCGRAKQFFRSACRLRLIEENPFADMKHLVVGASDPERDHFVTRDDAFRVLEACPDVQWQLLFALSRFGGLRCPSEPRELTWADIDFERGRMIVRSPKTARHEGKESRIVPIFQELRPYLEEAHHDALAEADQGKPLGHVITIPALRRDRYANVRSRMELIIQRAGLTPWPKLTHNMRASRETELAALFPAHVVCAWIGNSERIARKHYLRVTEADFDRAASRPALHAALHSAADALQSPVASPCQPPPKSGASGNGSQGEATLSVPPAWLELSEQSAENTAVPIRGAALHARRARQLDQLAECWPELTTDQIRAILDIARGNRRRMARRASRKPANAADGQRTNRRATH